MTTFICVRCRFRPVTTSGNAPGSIPGSIPGSTPEVLAAACLTHQLCMDCYALKSLNEGYRTAEAFLHQNPYTARRGQP